MFTRTRDQEDTVPEVIRVPKNISKDIQERGFHLYKWISPEEVKLSIERDFLKVLKIIGVPLAILALVFTFLSALNPIVFLFTVFVGVSMMFIYLLFLSIKRSRLLTKSAFVVMTDSSISLWWKIHKLSDMSGLKKDIDEVSTTFEENLFEESKLATSKKNLTDQVIEQLFWGYKKIFSLWDSRISFGRSKDSAQFMLIIIALYTAYVAIMASVYFVGVLWLLIFGKLLTWANTRYLIYRWHSVTKINQLFGDLDISSDNIKQQKSELKKLLTQAHDNQWKDWLLLEINAGIKDINSSAQWAVLEFMNLKNEISSSRYSDMFRFEIYHTWIKKQISKPLEDILSLLEKNRDVLSQTQDDIKKQINNTSKVELQWPLKLQLKRIKMQLRDVKQYIPMLEESISKLR